jgi:hypothetical protein
MSNLRENTILKFSLIFSSITFLAVILMAWYIFDNFKKDNTTDLKLDLSSAQSESTLSMTNNDPQVGGIVEKISKHMILPQGDFTVSVVKDEEGLKKQDAFAFKYAKLGNYVVFYPHGLIIYDAELDRIADVVTVLPK